MLDKEVGMLPVSLFVEIIKSIKEETFEKDSGIVPDSSLSERERNWRLVSKLNSCGILPMNLFVEISKSVKVEIFDKKVGMGPDNSLS